MQSAPQLIPAGADVTLPVPVPARVTVSVLIVRVNVAVTAAACVMVTTHVPVPVHPLPDHPRNVEPTAGAAVSVTVVPEAYASVQSVPHVIPAGADVTLPVPTPASAAVSVYVTRSNRAVAATALVPAGTLQVVDVPVHAPDQPANWEFAAGAAVSVIGAVAVSDALHALPQLMPAGEDVTVPVPVPVLDTVTARTLGSGSTESPPLQPVMTINPVAMMNAMARAAREDM